MWIAEVNSDLSGSPANVWWLLGILVTTLAGLATTWILSRRAKPEERAARAAEPVAALTSREAVDEYRQTFMVPLQADNTDLRERVRSLERSTAEAQQGQVEAERNALSAEAELGALRPQFQQALRELADERRRDHE